jgi:signal transduction histidine kinase
MTNTVKEKKYQIQTLHARATEDLVYTLKNPLFEEYFDLPETKSGNVYKDGVLQFTPKQNEVKAKLAQAIYNFQEKFQVDETCLIDATGQEHARLVLTKIAPNEDLSSEEAAAPFFASSFQKEELQVHVQYPYVSPDTNRWVFAYASPVVLGAGQKPAIYHFEMPLSIFQNLIKPQDGRMYVIDPQGFVVADSGYEFQSDGTSIVPKEYFPPPTMISQSDDFVQLVSEIKTKQNGIGMYNKNGETYHVVYEKLPTFDWILAYEKPHSLLLSGDETLDSLKYTVMIAGASIIAAVIVAIFIISDKMTRPIRNLIQACAEQNIQDPQPIETKAKDEVKDITAAINSMVTKISQTNKELSLKNEEVLAQNAEIRTAKTKAEELNLKLQDYMTKLEEAQEELRQQRDQLREEVRQKTKDLLNAERLSAIGQLSARIAHDLRNPLSVINGTAKMFRIKLEPHLDAKSREQLERLDRAVYRISHQLEDVLDYVRVPKLDKKDYSASLILKEVMERVEIPANIAIELPVNDCVINCDQEKMEVVLVNLFMNAIQAIGEKNGTIKIGIREEESHVLLNVSDSGDGISADILDKIFEPLFTTKQIGTGLGLSSCKSIVEHHGGIIEVSSTVGRGTTFIIKMPKKPDLVDVPEMKT